MEKLLNLLNEYGKGSSFQFTGYDRELSVFNTNLKAASITSIPEETIISKKLGFIQWLVEEDKIDHGAFSKIMTESNLFGNIADLTESECLIMYLSIQDDPIEFLVSVLK